MKRYLPFGIILSLIISGLLLMNGCDKNSTDTKEEVKEFTEEETQETAEAAYYSTLYAEAMTMPASALTAATSGSYALAKGAGTLDTILTGCPIATYNRTTRELFLDYGDSCIGAGGIKHSGSILLTGKLEGGQLVFTAKFNDYTINEYDLYGTIEFTMKLDSINISITDGSISTDSKFVTINGRIGMKVDANGTLQDPFDDTYKVSLGLRIVPGIPSEGPTKELSATVYARDPLIFKLFCQYPYKGTIHLLKMDIPEFETNIVHIDFEPLYGGCDDVAKVSTDGYEDVLIYLNDLIP